MLLKTVCFVTLIIMTLSVLSAQVSLTCCSLFPSTELVTVSVKWSITESNGWHSGTQIAALKPAHAVSKYFSLKTNKQTKPHKHQNERKLGSWLDSLLALGKLSGHQCGPHLIHQSSLKQMLIGNGSVEVPQYSVWSVNCYLDCQPRQHQLQYRIPGWSSQGWEPQNLCMKSLHSVLPNPGASTGDNKFPPKMSAQSVQCCKVGEKHFDCCSFASSIPAWGKL